MCRSLVKISVTGITSRQTTEKSNHIIERDAYHKRPRAKEQNDDKFWVSEYQATSNYYNTERKIINQIFYTL